MSYRNARSARTQGQTVGDRVARGEVCTCGHLREEHRTDLPGGAGRCLGETIGREAERPDTFIGSCACCRFVRQRR